MTRREIIQSTSSARASSGRRHVDAERLSGLQIDDEFELVGCITGKSAGFSPLECGRYKGPAWRLPSVLLDP